VATNSEEHNSELYYYLPSNPRPKHSGQ